MQICRCTDIQIYRYTDIQIYRYTGIQIYIYTDILIYRYTDIQIYRYTDIQIYRNTDIQEYRYKLTERTLPVIIKNICLGSYACVIYILFVSLFLRRHAVINWTLPCVCVLMISPFTSIPYLCVDVGAW